MKANIIRSIACIAIAIFITAPVARCASSVVITWRNETGYELKNQAGVALSAGQFGLAGDGTALELGYYSLATTMNPFAGQWIPLTGQSFPSRGPTTMGDKLPGIAGLFDITTQLLTEEDPSFLAAVGRPLSIRFYNQITTASSTFFNAVSAGTWVLQPLTDNIQSEMLMDLSAAPLVWEGGSSGSRVFRTVIAIPEPSCLFLIGLSGFCLLSHRRFRCGTSHPLHNG